MFGEPARAISRNVMVIALGFLPLMLPRRWLKRLDPKVSSEIPKLAEHLVPHSPLSRRISK